MAFDNDRILTQIKLKGALPTGRFSDAELLTLATDQLINIVAPIILGSREEYFNRNADTALVASQAAYPIPERAIGQALRSVQLLDGTNYIDLEHLSPEDAISTEEGTPQFFYLEGNDVILYPTPDSSQTTKTLRLKYACRPSRLVETAEAAQITAINTGTKTLTITTPTGWTTTNTFDLIGNTNGFNLKGLDLAATTVNTTSIIMTNTLPSTLAVGDYIALAGESPLPQVPVEGHQLLIMLAVKEALDSMGANSESVVSKDNIQTLAEGLKLVIQNRVQGAARRFRRHL